MKKIPYGISNYKELIRDGYYYVDKTMYIEKLEGLNEKRIMYLRPRKFGKTLFTSTIEHYYDVNAKDEFDELYGETYIGKNPTKLKNSYHILRFNFSGIDTSSVDTTIKGFTSEVESSIGVFVGKYGLDFYVNENDAAENILDNLFKAFCLQKKDEKIYVIIDEYDHFANELLGFDTDKFRDLVSKNGKVRKWYEILKKGTESVVDRIFITGVAPITLDSLTSGFNILSDKTRDIRFNEMLGFSRREIIQIMDYYGFDESKKEELLPIMKENYDGYKFSLNANERMYNSNMCLFFLSEYFVENKIPRNFVDVNIASDYTKIGKMLDFCSGEKREEILVKTMAGEGIAIELVEKFNPVLEFTEREFASMLFYLGYLTINEEKLGKPELIIPNNVMREIYSEYFMKMINKKSEFCVDNSDYNVMLEEIALNGRIDKIIECLGKYLNNLSNRDYQRFDEKYVKLIFYCIAMNLKIFSVRSEMEFNRKYPDILIVPRDRSKGYKAVMIEFKYLKKDEKSLLEEKQKEARMQIEEYRNFDDVRNIKDLSCYSVVAVNDELFVEKL